ncbi:Dabb family protein [Pedobacter sp. GSP4]|uniref:Dabb family protein n=1 Tax=Pedobacter sp. GSP4 TaxID=3453716 RepID=UPI003EEC0B93
MKKQFIHQVLFWTKNEADTVALIKGLESLKAIQGINTFLIGKPANNSHKFEMVDNSYQVALLIGFNAEVHRDQYETDPIHTKLIADFHLLWEKVVVYDFTN